MAVKYKIHELDGNIVVEIRGNEIVIRSENLVSAVATGSLPILYKIGRLDGRIFMNGQHAVTAGLMYKDGFPEKAMIYLIPHVVEKIMEAGAIVRSRKKLGANQHKYQLN